MREVAVRLSRLARVEFFSTLASKGAAPIRSFLVIYLGPRRIEVLSLKSLCIKGLKC